MTLKRHERRQLRKAVETAARQEGIKKRADIGALQLAAVEQELSPTGINIPALQQYIATQAAAKRAAATTVVADRAPSAEESPAASPPATPTTPIAPVGASDLTAQRQALEAQLAALERQKHTLEQQQQAAEAQTKLAGQFQALGI